MDPINKGKQWIIQTIMGYINTYFVNILAEDIQLALTSGSCIIDDLDLNTEQIDRDYELPISIISCRIHNVRVEIPWYKFLTAVAVKVETIEVKIKMKENFQNEKDATKSQNTGLKETVLSYTEKSISKLINKMIENLSISCNRITIQFYDEDIVIQIDINSFELKSSKDDWTDQCKNRASMLSRWTLSKTGNIGEYSISINNADQTTGHPKQYILEPFMLNNTFSLRLCCGFQSFNSYKLYSIQLDIFTSEMTVAITEPHILLLWSLMNSVLKKYESSCQKNFIEEYDVIPSTSSVSENMSSKESWLDWIVVSSKNIQTQSQSSYQLLNIGVYTNTFKLLFCSDVEKILNKYKPLTKIICNGFVFKTVHSPLNSLKVKLGICETIVSSEEHCSCGLNNCSYSQELYLTSGQMHNGYLNNSFFQNSNNKFSNENEFFVLEDINSENITLMNNSSFGLNYLIYYKPIEKCMVIMEAGDCVVNLMPGLIRRLQSINTLFLSHDKSSQTSPVIYTEEEQNHLKKYAAQSITYAFKMPNVVIKILPFTHEGSNYHSKNSKKSVNFLESFILIHKLRGSIVIPYNCKIWSTIMSIQTILKEGQVLSTTNFNVQARQIKANICVLKTTYTLLSLKNIEFNKTVNCSIEKKSDNFLVVDSTRFQSSKENYLLFYYIISSLISENESDREYANDCIFNSKLLENHPNCVDSAILVWKNDVVKIRFSIFENKSFNCELKLKNISSKIFKTRDTDKRNQTNNKSWSKVISMTNELEDSILPDLHAIIQNAPDKDDINQMPLIYLKSQKLSINFDPLFLEWLVYVPESHTKKETKLTPRVSNTEVQKNVLSDSLTDSSENKSIRFQTCSYWLNEWKSLPIFINCSSISLYLPNNIVWSSNWSFNLEDNDDTITVDKWIERLIDYDVDVIIIGLSSLTLNCALDENQIYTYLGIFPVIFSDSIWSREKSVFPWEINLTQLKFYMIDKQVLLSKSEIKLFETFDVTCSFSILSSTSASDHRTELEDFYVLLECRVVEPIIDIYVSEKQVMLVEKVLKYLKDIQKVLSNEELSTIGYETMSNTNEKDNEEHFDGNMKTSMTAENVFERTIRSTTLSIIDKKINDNFKKNSAKMPRFKRFNMPSNENMNQLDFVEIKVILNNFNIHFLKYEELGQFELLSCFCFYRPKIIWLLTRHSESFQILLNNLTMHTTCSIKTKKNELPKSKDYSMVFFETNSENISVIGSEFLIIHFSKPNDDHTCSQIKINLERNVFLSIQKITIDTMITLMEMINLFMSTKTDHHISDEDSKTILLDNDSTNISAQFYSFDESTSDNKTCNIDENVLQNQIHSLPKDDKSEKRSIHSLGENLTESPDLKLYKTIEEVISFKEMFNHFNWTVSMKSCKLFVQLSTETKDHNITLGVEKTYWELHSKQEMHLKKLTEIQQINGDISMDGLAISLGNLNSKEILLHSTVIIIKTKFSNSRFQPNCELNINTNNLSLDFSKSHCEKVLTILNGYKYLFETPPNNTTQDDNHSINESFYRDSFANSFDIIISNHRNVPPPYKIEFLNSSSEQFEITWTYPQFRTLKSILVESKLIELETNVKVELYWYDKMQARFHCPGTIILRPQVKHTISTFEMGKGISDTWRMIVDNKNLRLTSSEIQSLISSTKVESYFSPSFVPSIQIAVFLLSTQVNVLYEINNILPLSRYQSVSRVLKKYHKLIHLQLNNVLVGCTICKNTTNISATSDVSCKLLLYENLTDILTVEFFFDFANCFATNSTLHMNRFDLITGDLNCQIEPNIINLTTDAANLWSNHSSVHTSPYVICNDTCYTIIFGQVETDEKIVIKSLECCNYSWFSYTKNQCIQLAIKCDNNEIHWSKETTNLHEKNNKYLVVKDQNDQTIILITSIQPISQITVKATITSTLRLMNKTVSFLDSYITVFQDSDYGQHNNQYRLTINPFEISPSFMFQHNDSLSIKLRFSNSENIWSDVLIMKNLNKSNNIRYCSLITIPKRGDVEITSSRVLCHLIKETVEDTPKILILLLPPYIISSFLPNDIVLTVNVISNQNQTIRSRIIEVKSAIQQIQNIEQIDLPIMSFINSDDLVFNLNEKYPSLSILDCINTSRDSRKITISSIDDGLNDQYVSTKPDLKWPFVGNQFDGVQWKAGVKYENADTSLQMQNYGVVNEIGVSTRLISIQPWALIVNTTGTTILLFSSSSILCTLIDTSVTTPPTFDKQVQLYIKIGTNHGLRSSPLKLFGDNKLQMLDKQIIFPSSEKSVAYLSVQSFKYLNMNVVHFQSLFVVTNCSSIDIDLLAVCAMPTSQPFNIPSYSKSSFINLPKTSESWGKPLALWTPLDAPFAVSVERLDRYLILASGGDIGCPVKLSDLMTDDRPCSVPVVFSSCPDRSVCVSLTERGHQHTVTVRDDRSPPALVFRNCCATCTVFLTTDRAFEEPIPRFAAHCNWSYKIQPGGVSRLSAFPRLTPDGRVQVVHVRQRDPKPPHASRRFASITVDHNQCTASYVESNKNYMEIKIFKKAFTWEVLFCDIATADTGTVCPLSFDKEQQLFVNGSIKSIILTLTAREPTSNKLLTATFDKVKITMKPNDESKGQIKLRLTIDDVKVINSMIDSQKIFDFPVILNTKPENFNKATSVKEYLSQLMIEQNSVITITLTIDYSSYSDPAITDVDVSLPTAQVSIENRYLIELSKYFEEAAVKVPTTNANRDDSRREELVPIDVASSSRCVADRPRQFRSLKVSPFALLANVHWSALCFLSLNSAYLEFAEFQSDGEGLQELRARALAHYVYGNAARNAVNAIGSLGLIGSPLNLVRMVRRGTNVFAETLSREAAAGGPKGYLYGLSRGTLSLATHVSLGILCAASCFAGSWSRTFGSATRMLFITRTLSRVFNAASAISDRCVEYLLDSAFESAAVGDSEVD